MFLRNNTKFIPVENPDMSPERVGNSCISMEERITGYAEINSTYTVEEALKESSRCLKCPTHWCQRNCPANVPVTDFIAQVRAGDYEAAYELISSASMLPEFCSRVCPQHKQCQSECTRGIRTQAIGIGRLERFVTEQHYVSGIGEKTGEFTGKRIAVVGSGPSGLSVASKLIRFGHQVTVFERSDRPGGMLEYGIPNMKLDKGIVARKVEAMKKAGVIFCTNTNVGVDVTAEALREEFDAIVLSAGTANARALKLNNSEGVYGIVPAVSYLTENTKAVLSRCESTISAKGKKVVVVGGGDTGSDCVGTAIRQGCSSLIQIEMMPKVIGKETILRVTPQRAPEQKIDTSMEESEFVFGKDPHVYQTTVKSVRSDEKGGLTEITTVALQPQYDSACRLVMTELPGSEQTLPCELLIVAAGFIGPEAKLAECFGIETDGRTNLKAADYQTSVPGVFACGDCRTGQSLVVKAMVDGRECAAAVHQYLMDR